mgnify:FL=1
MGHDLCSKCVIIGENDVPEERSSRKRERRVSGKVSKRRMSVYASVKGKIIKGIAGFYYVHVPGQGVYECKAKGIFRKNNQIPLVGDDVCMDIVDETVHTGNIVEILDRRSELIRPAVANVDQALVIFSVVKPQPNFNLLDRFLIMMQQQKIPCIICFNKEDLDEEGKGEGYRQIYQNCGYMPLLTSARGQVGIREIGRLLAGKTTTVAGPSGVGKSTIINSLQTSVRMQTGAISRKIDRGKHTTRHSELIALENGYVLDTPGFSSLGLFDLEKEQLQEYYPEFASFERECRFSGCSHISEPDCGVKKALAAGLVSPMRYENYCALYEELKNRRKY